MGLTTLISRVRRKGITGSVRAAAMRVWHSDRFAYFDQPFSYRKDGLATIHNAEFSTEPRFARAYAASAAAGSWNGPWGTADPEWRAYIASWAAAHGSRLEGDFVECGVYRGGLSLTAMEYIGFRAMPQRLFWLLDTFAGIPPEQQSAAEQDRWKYDDTFEYVTRLFSTYPNVRIVRGKVPETLAAVTSERICYLSLDMNIVQPEIAAAEYFWDRLVSGAFVVLDDYGWPTHRAQKIAFDAFARMRDRQVLALPTGQGLIVK